MIQFKNVEKLLAQIRAKTAKALKDSKTYAEVGYSANYALHVHERTDIPHKNGQAKFLEEPARKMKNELATTIREGIKAGLTVGQAILMAALKLQRASQLLVPVDTGHLKNSAYTRLKQG